MSTDETTRIISRSFEMRGVSAAPAANGETDFKGTTAVFDTEERIGFLKAYAAMARNFFNDPHGDALAVEPEKIRAAVKTLKPQPVPTVRKRLPLETWHYAVEQTGPSLYPPSASLDAWCRSLPQGLVLKHNALEWHTPCACTITFDPQPWRAFFWLTLWLPNSHDSAVVRLGSRLEVRLQPGQPVQIGGRMLGPALPPPGNAFTVKFELDDAEDEGHAHVLVDDQRVGDWLPLVPGEQVTTLTMEGPAGMRMTACRGLGFEKATFTDNIRDRDEPYAFRPLFQYDFHSVPSLDGWSVPGYDETGWRPTTLPCVHGGAMEAGEDVLLRTTFVSPSTPRATLVVETLDPGGEIWLNGRLVHQQRGPQGFTVDITHDLQPDKDNVLAVRVRHRTPGRRMRHTCTDRHTGWFLGRAHIDFHEDVFLEHLFVWTRALGSTATLNWQVDFRNTAWGQEETEALAPLIESGTIDIEIAPWFPEEGPPIASATASVQARLYEPMTVRGTLDVPNPRLWSVESPTLYRVHAVLKDEQGHARDDRVITIGLRTLSQENGIFRLNGTPAMMNGGLLFGMRPPIETQAKYLRCGKLEHLVRDVLTVRELGGNTIRMSVHDGPARGINDPRLAEIGDQLGILFQWTTNAWVRTSSAWQIDFDGLAADVRQVRNHPSIAMWQPGNHPKFRDWEDEGSRWYTRVVDTILAQDASRLISPTANATQLHAPSEDGLHNEVGEPTAPIPAWRHPQVVRGNMDTPTGYGAGWSIVRLWPKPKDWDGVQGWIRSGYREEHLNSPHHAYFDFESEESAAQPHWCLQRGQPWHGIRSYELNYDRGSIGRELKLDEWDISQAWQAFSGSEAYRKKRWLDYDGLAWCTIDGGGNSGTYEKPLTDTLGYKKLAFHAIKMVFQPTLAGSADVDTVYGPDDAIRPLILHVGPAMTVDLLVEIRPAEPGRPVAAARRYANVALPAGRHRVDLDPWPLPTLEEGLYGLEYTVIQRGVTSA